VFDVSLKIHKDIGPGLLESVYEECLFYELKENGLLVEKQKPMPFIYNEVRMDVGYRLDLLVENKVVIEVIACEGLTDVHLAQVLTYLKLTNCKLGLLINFNVALLKNGFRRVVNKL
jgi:GxxExxY protein